MTLPVVWIPEANEDLLEARAWYDNIRVEVGERDSPGKDVANDMVGAAPSNSRPI